MKRWITLGLTLVCVLSLVGCHKKQEDTYEAKHVFQAQVIEIMNETMLVKPLQGYSEAEYSEQVSVGIQNMPDSQKPMIGDIVEITYSGIMMEVYPPIPSGVEKIVVLEDNE